MRKSVTNGSTRVLQKYTVFCLIELKSVAARVRKVLQMVRVCVHMYVTKGTCVRTKKCCEWYVCTCTNARVCCKWYVCACAPKNMDHCEPNKPCHLPDWKIWMIDAGPFQVQTKIR